MSLESPSLTQGNATPHDDGAVKEVFETLFPNSVSLAYFALSVYKKQQMDPSEYQRLIDAVKVKSNSEQIMNLLKGSSKNIIQVFLSNLMQGIQFPTTPDAVLEYRAGREKGIKGIEAKLTSIKAMCDSMIREGKFFFQKRAGLGMFATFAYLPGMPTNRSGKQEFGCYDASSHLMGTSEDYASIDYTKYGSWTALIRRNEIKLQAIIGSDPQDRKDGPVREFMLSDNVQNAEVGLCSTEKMQKLLGAINIYYEAQNSGQTLSESEQIAAWMYLTGYYGWLLWLADYDDTNNTRSYLSCHADYRWFAQHYDAVIYGGFLLTD